MGIRERDGRVNGTFRNSGVAVTVTGTITFNSGGTYQHNFSSAVETIPASTWSAGSTCEIIGYASTTITINSSYSQAFHHFTWNCTS